MGRQKAPRQIVDQIEETARTRFSTYIRIILIRIRIYIYIYTRRASVIRATGVTATRRDTCANPTPMRIYYYGIGRRGTGRDGDLISPARDRNRRFRVPHRFFGATFNGHLTQTRIQNVGWSATVEARSGGRKGHGELAGALSLPGPTTTSNARPFCQIELASR